MNKKEMKQSTKLSIDLITTIIVTLIAGAVTVAAVISMAWFASNKDVTGTDASVTVDAELFEIGSDKRISLGSNLVSPLNNAGFYNDIDPLQTNSNKSGIFCELEIDSYYKGEKETKIRPGSYGKLIFKILPKRDNLIFKANLSIAGIRKSGASSFEFVNGDYTNVDSATQEEVLKAFKLLNGHVVIYANRTESAGVVSYSNQINNPIVHLGEGEDSSIYITGASEKGEVYEVTLYWVWVRTYDELKEMLGKVPGSETNYKVDEPELVDFLFDGITEGTADTPATGSEGYNNGDQTIGDNIYYVISELNIDAYSESVDGKTVIAATKKET
ncbi:MAG: hypothetical protein II881_08910 [Oscillospiraceae bacterium]|nr:hypothetical protein [Oscillospiraceae bacterium]